MNKNMMLSMALAVALSPVAVFADTGTIKFKGGCAVSNSGSCTIAVTGNPAPVKLYAAPSIDGKYGTVSKLFDGSKRIANSKNNVCFYARGQNAANRTPIICLAK